MWASSKGNVAPTSSKHATVMPHDIASRSGKAGAKETIPAQGMGDLPSLTKAASRQAVFIREANRLTMDNILCIGSDEQVVLASGVKPMA